MQLTNHAFLSLQSTLQSSASLLKSAHPYPLPSFPGRTQEDLVGQLLRKKLAPQVEDWISEGQTLATTIPGLENTSTTNRINGLVAPAGEETDQPKGLNSEQLKQLWELAGPEANRIAREDIGGEAWEDDFTIAENEAGIENVITGLRRKLWEDDDDDEAAKQENEDSMEIDQVPEKDDAKAVDEASAVMMARNVDDTRPAMSLEAVLKFALTGALPPASAPAGPGAQIRR